MTSLTISIDRTGMAGDPEPIVLSGLLDDPASDTVLAVIGYSDPARQARVRYAPPSDFSHGEIPLGWTWQQSQLLFDVKAFAANETVGQAAKIELEAAVSRLTYLVTVVINGAPSQTWTCSAGSVVPLRARSYVDLANASPAWSVALPCHPVPTIGA